MCVFLGFCFTFFVSESISCFLSGTNFRGFLNHLFLQIISNDEYKSVEHRVLANPLQEPRVSVAVFCNPSNRDGLFGPLPELVSQEKPARYRQFTLSDYMQRFFKKELDGKTLTNYYRLWNSNSPSQHCLNTTSPIYTHKHNRANIAWTPLHICLSRVNTWLNN